MSSTSTQTRSTFDNYERIAYDTPILPRDEEFKLLTIIKGKTRGKSAATDKLVKSYLRTIIEMARQFQKNTHIDLDDFIQCGVAGLMSSIELFKLSRYKKSGFANWCKLYIKRAMEDCYRKNIRPVEISSYGNRRTQLLNRLYKQGKLSFKSEDQIKKYIVKVLDVDDEYAGDPYQFIQTCC